MNQNTINVLVEKVSSEWKRFARMTHLRDVDSIIDEIDYDPDITEEKFKMERFLMKLYHHHPVDYMNLIEESLKKMPRNDLLKDLGFDMSKSLKKLYLSLYKNREQLLHNCSYPAAVNQTENFIELNMVDANEIASDVICFDEKNYYIQKYSSIKQNFVNCNRVLSTDFDLLLIAGGAGIGKTCFLQKCVLDWANDLIWNTYDYVFYLECRRLNQYKQLKTVNSLLQEFYKDVLNDKEILANKSTLFVVDGLEEFVYLDDLLNSNEDNNPSVHPIVIALEQILSTKKCVVAGRVGAVMAYRKKNKIHREIKFVQIMGFSNDSIENYICKFLKSKADQRVVKEFLEKSRIAKTMASVPFFFISDLFNPSLFQS